MSNDSQPKSLADVAAEEATTTETGPANTLEDLGWGVNALTPEQLEEQAAADPCFPIRNLAGHRVDCNYGDFPNFTKCKCAQGLLTLPEAVAVVAVSPLPLRDHFAASVHVSDDLAHDLAAGIKAERKKAEEKEKRIHTVGNVLGLDQPERPPTIVELADAKAKIRYLEADAMIYWRVESARQQVEAMINAKAEADKADAPRIVTP